MPVAKSIFIDSTFVFVIVKEGGSLCFGIMEEISHDTKGYFFCLN